MLSPPYLMFSHLISLLQPLLSVLNIQMGKHTHSVSGEDVTYSSVLACLLPSFIN